MLYKEGIAITLLQNVLVFNRICFKENFFNGIYTHVFLLCCMLYQRARKSPVNRTTPLTHANQSNITKIEYRPRFLQILLYFNYGPRMLLCLFILYVKRWMYTLIYYNYYYCSYIFHVTIFKKVLLTAVYKYDFFCKNWITTNYLIYFLTTVYLSYWAI